jgi:mono/diheme cytochrome c family protein
MNQSVRRLVVIGIAFFLPAVLVTEFISAALSAQRRRDRSTSSAARVDDLFRSNCARCHGADGRGDTPLGHTYKAPDFTDAEWWRKHARITSTGSLVAIVSRGRGGMPAFGKKLTRSKIKLLVSHVRSFRNN